MNEKDETKPRLQLDAEPMLQWFDGSNTAGHAEFLLAQCAQNIVDTVPRNAERSVALRKLVEAQDAIGRARRSK